MRIRLPIMLACLLAAPAFAQQAAWPARTVKFVVPTTPSGGTDLVARLMSEKLRNTLGQPVIVENRVGGGGNIATEYVAKQPPDGYTFLVTQSTHVTNVGFFKKLPYDPLNDFEPVSLLAVGPTFVLCVNNASPLKSIGDLIDLARAKGGDVTYGSAGFGTPHHLAMELFKSMTGTNMTHVPYKGSAPAAAAAVANEVNVTVGADNSMAQFVRAGRVRCLAATASRRSTIMPDVPTVAEAVPLPGYVIESWYGVLAPVGTPRPVIDRLNAELNQAIRDPQLVAEKLAPIGFAPVGTTPERFMEVMKADVAKFLKIARDAKVVPE